MSRPKVVSAPPAHMFPSQFPCRLKKPERIKVKDNLTPPLLNAAMHEEEGGGKEEKRRGLRED